MPVYHKLFYDILASKRFKMGLSGGKMYCGRQNIPSVCAMSNMVNIGYCIFKIR